VAELCGNEQAKTKIKDTLKEEKRKVADEANNLQRKLEGIGAAMTRATRKSGLLQIIQRLTCCMILRKKDRFKGTEELLFG